jgi:hypothetical protein
MCTGPTKSWVVDLDIVDAVQLVLAHGRAREPRRIDILSSTRGESGYEVRPRLRSINAERQLSLAGLHP